MGANASPTHSLTPGRCRNVALTIMKFAAWSTLPAFAIAFATACATPAVPPPDTSRELTVGVVQKEIRKGMPASEVAASLGSPNIVTKDGDGAEVWIYDRIASEANYSERAGYGSVLLLGISEIQRSTRLTQKTLTVIVKFDDSSKVTSFSYHASKF
jgi:outer membrane protein assembly factor BamE (lipoprotein component of BamABCDE complex)